MRTAAIIVAAGRGSRAGDGLPKQYRPICGVPVLAHTLRRFRAQTGISSIVLVIHPEDRALAEALADGAIIVEGAERRAGSVAAGLAAVPEDTTHVLIHDAARATVPQAVIGRVLDALKDAPAAAPALAVTDALWRGVDGFVEAATPRAGLWRAQTPQGFEISAIRAAHAAGDGDAADDVELARRAGIDVRIVEGHEDNIKITTAGDFARAERILGGGLDIRTGTGFDVHRFGPGSSVTLCGVEIAHERGLRGHSDADVGMHALTDAIYGALAEGDIGQHFPPTDPAFRGADSAMFLDHAATLARARGYTITHCDVTLICERPKIGPHAGAMRARLAGIMGLDPDRVSVKATTTEQLGFTGRGEGIAAQAVATLVKP